MQEYIFLFVLTLVWIVFAVFQDLRTREISNWLNFSLVAFALSYRAFYSVFSNNYMFFVYGVLGVLFFVLLANIFYYGRVFAGGDAKLLMGLGAVLPFEKFIDVFAMGGFFVFLLFFAGAVYVLFYSPFLVFPMRKKFAVDFFKRVRKGKFYLVIGAIIGVVIYFLSRDFFEYPIAFFVLFVLFPLIYFYVKSMDKVCMVRLAKPSELTEGDWLCENVVVGKIKINKSVHGLSLKDIALLKKAKKSVLIKDGVPFAPAFIVAFVLFYALYFLGYSSINFY